MKIEKVVVGVPTYGNTQFTKMTIDHIIRTVKFPYELFSVVGKPKDIDTEKLLNRYSIPFISHKINKGLPASINDIYDYSFKEKNADGVVIVGNDVLPHWNSIDMLIEFANSSDYDWISGSPVTTNGLISRVPSTSVYFGGGEKNKNFTGDRLTEWLDKYVPSEKKLIIDLERFAIVGDSHNMCLFTKKLFDSVGYVDVNFYPAYYEDNDYSRRAKLAGIKMCRLLESKYFHFWSRTIHQGNMKSTNDKYFPLNKAFYIEKWGGEPGKEKWKLPFNGTKGCINIQSRKKEESIIDRWIHK